MKPAQSFTTISECVRQLEEENVDLRRRAEEAEHFIREFEDTCQHLATDIFAEMCRGVMERMDKDGATAALWCADDFPDSFTFSDILSIEHQSMDYEEICHLLPDYIGGLLEDAYDRLPPREKAILSHAYLTTDYETDTEAILGDLHKAFNTAEDERYETDKVRGFIEGDHE